MKKSAITKRIQAAVTGFSIPMLSIVALNKHCEAHVAAGATDEQLRAAVAAFLAGIQ